MSKLLFRFTRRFFSLADKKKNVLKDANINKIAERNVNKLTEEEKIIMIERINEKAKSSLTKVVLFIVGGSLCFYFYSKFKFPLRSKQLTDSYNTSINAITLTTLMFSGLLIGFTYSNKSIQNKNLFKLSLFIGGTAQLLSLYQTIEVDKLKFAFFAPFIFR
jgi:hypothetical protein